MTCCALCVVCCVCLCDFFFVFILSSSLVWPPALFVCGGLCVRY